MAERLRCPPHIEARATASLVGVLASTPTVMVAEGMAVRADLAVGDDTYALVARGPAAGQLSAARPGDCLSVCGSIILHDNPVNGKRRKSMTIEVQCVTIESRARSNIA